MKPTTLVNVRRCLIALLSVPVAVAAPDVIGVASSAGAFRMDGLAVISSAGVTDGSRIETVDQPARIALRGGARVDMGVESRVQVHGGRVLLERGRSHITGPVDVANKGGILVARLEAGKELFFDAPETPSVAAELTGPVEARGSALVITDELSHLSFQVSGGPEMLLQMKRSLGDRLRLEGILSKDGSEIRADRFRNLGPARPAQQHVAKAERRAGLKPDESAEVPASSPSTPPSTGGTPATAGKRASESAKPQGAGAPAKVSVSAGAVGQSAVQRAIIAGVVIAAYGAAPVISIMSAPASTTTISQ